MGLRAEGFECGSGNSECGKKEKKRSRKNRAESIGLRAEDRILKSEKRIESKFLRLSEVSEFAKQKNRRKYRRFFL
jgi:hypothetical protein